MPLAIMLAAAVTAATPLAPAGPWVVRESDELCRLERPYANGKRPVSLMFQPLLDLDDTELFVVGGEPSDREYHGDFQAIAAPGDRRYTGKYFSVINRTLRARVTRLTITRAALTELADGDTFAIQARPIDVAFAVDGMADARATLDGCVERLKVKWGIDESIAARTVTPLEGNPAHFFNADSYPIEALRQHVYGRVVALLNVGVDGAVTGCRIVSSAGQSLNEGTCLAARRIRFSPARDKDGQALPSTYVLPVRWIYPGTSG